MAPLHPAHTCECVRWSRNALHVLRLPLDLQRSYNNITYTSSRQIYISWLLRCMRRERSMQEQGLIYPLHASSSHLFIAASDQLTYIVCNLNWPTWGACGRSPTKPILCAAPLKAKAHLGKVQKAQVDMFLLQKAQSIINGCFLLNGRASATYIFHCYISKICFIFYNFWIIGLDLKIKT